MDLHLVNIVAKYKVPHQYAKFYRQEILQLYKVPQVSFVFYPLHAQCIPVMA